MEQQSHEPQPPVLHPRLWSTGSRADGLKDQFCKVPSEHQQMLDTYGYIYFLGGLKIRQIETALALTRLVSG
jgi:hypothetical protein